MASTLRAVFFIKADGTGLNLPIANQVFPFDRWSNPMVEEQVMDRSWRIDT
jgi:SNF2 family DNA or RNA helicase